MNNILIDGITNIDDELIEKYFAIKAKMADERARKNKTRLAWRTIGAAAACICLAVLITLPLILRGNDTEYTSYRTYEEVAQVIGPDTLLKNIDFSGIKNHSIKVFHKSGDAGQHKKLEFIADAAEYSYELDISFDKDDDNSAHYKGGLVEEIKGIPVAIVRREASNDTVQYVAVFEYNNCKYVFRSRSGISEDGFYALLNEILN